MGSADREARSISSKWSLLHPLSYIASACLPIRAARTPWRAPVRPFYHEFAWAYAAILDAPVAQRCDFIERVLRRLRLREPVRLLDAGCGPGQYSADLAQRGFQVVGLDASEPFVRQAQQTYGALPHAPRFVQENLLDLGPPGDGGLFDGILCRGVLNDLVGVAPRQRVMHAFARVLRPGGMLLFDVREWTMTARRIAQNPTFVKEVATERGVVTFRSVTRLDPPTRQLHIHEHHHLHGLGEESERSYDFVMQCWTREEVTDALVAAGFRVIEEWGAYDERVPPGATDRLVVAACLHVNGSGSSVVSAHPSLEEPRDEPP